MAETPPLSPTGDSHGDGTGPAPAAVAEPRRATPIRISRIVTALVITVIGLVALGLGPLRDEVPPPNATISVETAPPLRVVVGTNPTAADIADEIAARLDAEISGSGGNRPKAIERVMRSVATDPAYLENLGSRAADDFEAGLAGALAFSLYGVSVDGSAVTVTSLNIEVLPRVRNMALSRAHEDGHALINDLIAEACGPALVASGLDERLNSGELEAMVVRELRAISASAHERYHEIVDDHAPEGHDVSARLAGDDIIAERCAGTVSG